MRVNALLVRYEDGYRESSSVGLTGTDGSSLTTPGGELLLSTSQGAGRLEGFVNYPEDSSGEAERKAASVITDLESARWQTTVGIEPTGTGDVPLSDWDVADTITVPDQDGSPQALQVTGLLLTEDEAGHPVYRPRVGDRIPSVDERRATTNRNFNAGDLGGRDPQAMPRGAVRSGVAAKVASPAIGSGKGGPPTILVAASDAHPSSKSAAHFICTGTNDHLAINQAIAAAQSGGGGRGRVVLSEGSFDCAAELDYVDILEGVGGNTVTQVRFSSAIAGYGAYAGSAAHIRFQAVGVSVSTMLALEWEGVDLNVSPTGGGSITTGVLVDGYSVSLSHVVVGSCTVGLQLSSSSSYVLASALDMGSCTTAVDIDAGTTMAISSSRFYVNAASRTAIVNDGSLAISSSFFVASTSSGTVGIDNNSTLNSGAAANCLFSGFGTNIA